jgi:hypothetical protein
MKDMEMDDQKRGSAGVICSVRGLPNGKLRIVMDDVTNSSRLRQGPWEHRVLVTWKDYEPAELESLESLSEAELAGFGHYVLARLMATRSAAT